MFNVKIKDLIKKEIFQIEPGKIFTYSDLKVYLSNPTTRVKVVGFLLERNEIKNFIRRNQFKKFVKKEILPSFRNKK